MKADQKNALGWALLLALLATVPGCASAPFVRGVTIYGTDIVDEARDYLAADTDSDTATLADRTLIVDRFEAALKANPVTLAGVKEPWEPFRLIYGNYVDNDADLDPEEKALRAANVVRMDRLIEAEGSRFIYGGSGG